MMCSERQFLLGEEHNMPNEYKQVEVSSHGFKGNTPFDMDLISGVSPEIATVFVEEENHSLNSLKNNSSQPLDSCPNGDNLNIVSNGNASEDDGIAMGDSIPSTCKQSSIDDIESNPNIWTPPEPEDWGDEVEMSVANNDDDDDEYYDGTKWTQPSSLDNLDDGFTVHNHFKEERQRAMMEVMNGQLKYLVIQLFETAGIPLVMEDSGESWLPIISSLAWEAAMYLKPDVSEGNSMDIGSYVKVKCIASGSPSQSEMIKGLVFKKNTAHKHMSTKIANPRLLLLMGALGQNAVGLSSFNSMDQEMDYLKFAAEIVKSCSPNVVLVEKTVSRDIQECLLKKGITLVFDMNLNRLKKISRCTGSPIIATSEVPLNPQLRQCDLFRVEKFAEEHNRNGEGGKTPNKTLMFLEGCPKPHGCTILLRGAPSDVLKRMKRLVHYTVFGAYHLILETSFFIDQRATLSNNANSKINGDAALDSPNLNGEFSYLFDDDGANPLASNEESTSSIYHLDGLDCNGEEELHNPERSSLSLEQVMASTSSLNGKIEEPIATSHGSVSNGSDLSSSHGSKEKEVHSLLHASLSSETLDSDDCGFPDKKNEQTLKSTMDSKSILVLSSSLCRFKDIICEQSHLSRIKYYGNSDMSLGRFIQDILLNKKHSCSVCNEPPESHAFSYTHVNGKLTALVKRLSAEKRLPGEEEGKIWMWTRCLKCEDERSVLEPSRRVVMSNSAHGLSFGKFLELSFSTHSASKRFFRCGHSLQRDCLRFFGLGSLVGMFMYQPVDLFTACDPPPVLEFSTPRGDDWLKIVAKELLQKVQLLFAEIGRALEKMKPELIWRQQKKFPGSLKEFGEVEELWREEKLDLEDPLMRIIHNEEQNMLDLPFLEWELLLEHYAWDQRLHSLLSSAREESESPESSAAELEAETTEEDQSNGVDASDSPVDPFASDDGLVNAVSYDQESQRGPRFLESSIWASSGMRKAYRENLTRGHSRRFDFLLGYSPLHLSPAVKLEREWVHLPVGPDGHVISVCEDEISSLIAYAVATWQNQVPSSAEAAPALRSEASFYLSSFNSLDPEVLRTSSFSSFSSEDSMASAPAEYSGESSPAENLHPEVNLSAAGPVDCSVFCVHAKQFLELRRRCCSSEAGYLNSLRRCKRWDAQGGKSKAFFAKTLDDRLIIKQIKKRELESFLKFAPDYFKHISHSLSTGNQTCLAKVLGIYRVKQMKNGKETKTDLMVMENLLYGREITRVYDLKGAIFARFVADASKASSVLLDQNFVHDMGFSPFYLGGKSKRHLQRAIWNDTSFLTSINVMDYSLLVGVDEQRREMVFGIIDYLRQYTWDKQLETWVKSSLVVPKNASPTVISPKDYKKRFRKFMSKHFLAVPGS